MATHRVCRNCELAFPNEDENHVTLQDCIRAHQVAARQKQELYRDMGMDMSLHFLRALEELSIRPDVGYRYTVWNPEDNQPFELPAVQVSGIFASLLKAYREQSNFQTDEEQKKVAAYWAMIAGKMGGLLVMWMERYEIEESDIAEAKLLLEKASEPTP
jgi:hypothetical protein